MTLQEIQYKAQSIISKWRDDDSAPYIEFVEELAHMIVPEPSEDLEEAAKNYAELLPQGRVSKKYSAIDFIAGAKWQAKRILEHVKLAYGKVSMNPFDCSEAFEELIDKINAL